MLSYVIRRLLISVVVLFLATVFVFLLVAYSGNPLGLLRLNPHTPLSTIIARENTLHLLDPLYQRYWIWLTGALHGNFGPDVAGIAVGPQLVSHWLVTMRMVVVSTILSIFLAISVGVIAALRHGKATDHVMTVTNFVFLAAPVFVVGLLLKEFVAIPINKGLGRLVLYTDGDQSPLLTGSFWQRLPDYAAHAILPSITLILATYASWAIYQRSTLLDIMDSDHVRLARSKGISPRRVLLRHILRNALIPVTTVIALDFAGVLGGAVVTEVVFGWQGLGVWFLNGVNNIDINVTMAYLLVTATIVVLFNLFADILYAVLDPRIRYER